jgi:hypothetical protein
MPNILFCKSYNFKGKQKRNQMRNCYNTGNLFCLITKPRIRNHYATPQYRLNLVTQPHQTWQDCPQYALNRIPECFRASLDMEVRRTISTCALNQTPVIQTRTSHFYDWPIPAYVTNRYSSTSEVLVVSMLILLKGSIRDKYHHNDH